MHCFAPLPPKTYRNRDSGKHFKELFRIRYPLRKSVYEFLLMYFTTSAPCHESTGFSIILV